MRRFLHLVTAAGIALAGVAGCDSPTSPSPSLAGNWAGTWQFRSGGVIVTEDVTATFTQNGSNATGTWTAQSGSTGQLTLSAGDAVSGTMTISQTLFTGQVCNGNTTVTGTATSSTLELTAAQVAASGLCQWASEMRFSLQK